MFKNVFVYYKSIYLCRLNFNKSIINLKNYFIYENY